MKDKDHIETAPLVEYTINFLNNQESAFKRS